MATINERLNLLSSTTQMADRGPLTMRDLEEQKRKTTNVDYKMVTFSLAGKDYGIDIMKVKERAKASAFTYVPNTLPFVRGVYNLRGEIIPVVDLRLFFNIEVEDQGDDVVENMLIVNIGEQIYGVVVDSIDKVVGVQSSTIQPPHPLFGDINIKYIYGVVEAENRLYILLDIEKIFGVKSAEEEKRIQEEVKEQMKLRQEAAIEVAVKEQHKIAPAPTFNSSEEAPTQTNATNVVQQEIQKKEVDLNFIAASLLSLKKFVLNSVNEEWARKRYAEWAEERGEKNTQLSSQADADEFLKTFYSKCNGTWWTEEYAQIVEAALPENTAKNIVVWNLGCGKGYESYSLACILKARYPKAHIRIYAHDVDLLAVSNAPLLTVPEDVAEGWFAPYLSKTVSGEYTFSKEIKDMVMFEYHNVVNSNNLPDIDIVFARDVLSFIPETSQKVIFDDFAEKVKGNGLIVLGENEKLNLPDWKLGKVDGIRLYTK